MHAIYARTAGGDIAQGLSFESYDDAITEWTRLNDARIAGQFPQVKHFEVRDITDPKYANAKRITTAFARVITPRGFGDEEWTKGRRTNPHSGAEKAARAAWHKFVPMVQDRRREQGLGGWYFYANGRPVAQGMHNLVRVALRHNLIAEGQNGRWYVTEIADPTHFERKEVAV